MIRFEVGLLSAVDSRLKRLLDEGGHQINQLSRSTITSIQMIKMPSNLQLNFVTSKRPNTEASRPSPLFCFFHSLWLFHGKTFDNLKTKIDAFSPGTFYQLDPLNITFNPSNRYRPSQVKKCIIYQPRTFPTRSRNPEIMTYKEQWYINLQIFSHRNQKQYTAM